MKPIFVKLEEGEVSWVQEYSIKKFKKGFITISRYPLTITTDPLNHKMVTVEEDGEYWFELVWEERPIITEEQLP